MRAASCTGTGRCLPTRSLASPYLAGKATGALDFLAVVVSKWAGTRAHVSKARPRFAATLRRIEAHALVKPVLGVALGHMMVDAMRALCAIVAYVRCERDRSAACRPGV